jgi:hypothetical protein
MSDHLTYDEAIQSMLSDILDLTYMLRKEMKPYFGLDSFESISEFFEQMHSASNNDYKKYISIRNIYISIMNKLINKIDEIEDNLGHRNIKMLKQSEIFKSIDKQVYLDLQNLIARCLYSMSHLRCFMIMLTHETISTEVISSLKYNKGTPLPFISYDSYYLNLEAIQFCYDNGLYTSKEMVLDYVDHYNACEMYDQSMFLLKIYSHNSS